MAVNREQPESGPGGKAQCPHCGVQRGVVTVKHNFGHYYRCERCGHTWSTNDRPPVS